MPLPNPIARQREVVCLPANGHQVVLGTAGSGKTTMAILRSAFLSDPEMPDHGATLLLTYNKSLGAFIRSIAAPELAHVTVEHFHKFARGYLRSQGLIGWNDVAAGWRRDGFIGQATAAVQKRDPSSTLFNKPPNFFSAEISWLAQHGISSVEDYVAVGRVGRAEARLERQFRPTMWEVRNEYLNARNGAGCRYDWDDLASAVSEALETDQDPRRYRHIVIDEGQDLSPEMLKALSKAIPEDGSITFFADVAQQIYGHRTSWRAAGLNPVKVWNFSENYRNTAEIARLGLAIAEMPYYAGITDMVAPTAPAAAGAKPTIVRFTDPSAELPFVVRQAERFAQTQSVAILTRSVRQMNEVRFFITTQAIDLRSENLTWVNGPQLYVGTLHSAKGLEFDAVILPRMAADHLPDPALIADLGEIDAQANDGRLLYVGVTRAKTSLIISHSGEITTLLPASTELYIRLDR